MKIQNLIQTMFTNQISILYRDLGTIIEFDRQIWMRIEWESYATIKAYTINSSPSSPSPSRFSISIGSLNHHHNHRKPNHHHHHRSNTTTVPLNHHNSRIRSIQPQDSSSRRIKQQQQPTAPAALITIGAAAVLDNRSIQQQQNAFKVITCDIRLIQVLFLTHNLIYIRLNS